MQLKSIQTKILLLAGVCLLVTSAALVGYSLYSAGKNQALVSQRVGKLLEEEAKRNLASLAAGYLAPRALRLPTRSAGWPVAPKKKKCCASWWTRWASRGSWGKTCTTWCRWPCCRRAGMPSR